MLYNFCAGYGEARTGERIQIKYFIVGIILTSVIGVLFNVVFVFFGRSDFIFWGPLSSIFLIVLTAYAIIRHRLMDIDIVIRKSIIYSVLITVIIALYSTLLLILQHLFQSTTRVNQWTATIITAFAIAVGYKPLETAIESLTNRVFFRRKYEYYRSLEDVSDKITESSSVKEILSALYKAFSDIIQASNPKIYLPENFFLKGGRQSHLFFWDKIDLKPQPESIEADDPLYITAIKSDDYILKDNIMNNALLKNALESRKLELVIPCVFRKKLVALILLGEKLSEEAYSEEDLRLLKDMANHAAITLENTRTYEEIKNDLHQEQERTENVSRQLERSQKLAQLGTLASGIAHEIRNPLAILRSKAETIPDKLDNKEFLLDYGLSVQRNIDRVLKIVSEMLDLAKIKDQVTEVVNINSVLEECLRLFATEKIKIATRFEDNIAIKGNKDQIAQVFINVIQNSFGAMPNGGVLSVSTSQIQYKDKPFIKIEISDTGIGIKEEDIEKLFTPFYTTRHEGAGLGLAITHRIVEENGGTIEARSKVNEGTTMTILFPSVN